MSLVTIFTYAGAALIALLSAKFGRDPKQYHCVDGYAQCISANVADSECKKILALCEKPKKEEEPRNRGEI